MRAHSAALEVIDSVGFSLSSAQRIDQTYVYKKVMPRYPSAKVVFMWQKVMGRDSGKNEFAKSSLASACFAMDAHWKCVRTTVRGLGPVSRCSTTPAKRPAPSAGVVPKSVMVIPVLTFAEFVQDQ